MRPKTLELSNQPNPLHLDLIVSQVQYNMGLENMSDPRYLDLVGLTNMSNLKHMDIASPISPR